MSLQFQNEEKITFLAALSMLFAIAENAIPHIFPFLKFGFSNIPILYAISIFSPRSYTILLLLKWLTGNLASGLLFSIFSIFSLLSTMTSGLLMYFFHHMLKKNLSVYGTSLIGAISSNIITLTLTSFYLETSLKSLIPYFLLFSLISGFMTAFLSEQIKLPDYLPIMEIKTKKNDKYRYIFLFPLIALIFTTLISSSIKIAIILFFALILQFYLKRKIKFNIFIMTFLCTILLSTFKQEGEILFLFITKQALSKGLYKALLLITITSLSQSISYLIRPNEGIIANTLLYSGSMISYFENSKKSIKERIRSLLDMSCFTSKPNESETARNPHFVILISLLVIIIKFV